MYYSAKAKDIKTITIPKPKPNTVGKSAPVSGTGNAVALPVAFVVDVALAVVVAFAVDVPFVVDVAVGVAVLVVLDAELVAVGVELDVAVGVAAPSVVVVKFETALPESQPSLVQAIILQ